MRAQHFYIYGTTVALSLTTGLEALQEAGMFEMWRFLLANMAKAALSKFSLKIPDLEFFHPGSTPSWPKLCEAMTFVLIANFSKT